MFPARQQNMASARHCVLLSVVYFLYATKAHAHACCLAHCAKAASASHPCELHCREMVRRGDGPCRVYLFRTDWTGLKRFDR